MQKPIKHQEAAMRHKSSLNSGVTSFLSTRHLTPLHRSEVLTAEEFLQNSVAAVNNKPFFYLTVTLT